MNTFHFMRIKWYGSRPRQHTKHNDEKSIQTCKNVHHHYCTRALAQKPKLVQLFLETYSTYTQCKCSSREGKKWGFLPIQAENMFFIHWELICADRQNGRHMLLTHWRGLCVSTANDRDMAALWGICSVIRALFSLAT